MEIQIAGDVITSAHYWPSFITSLVNFRSINSLPADSRFPRRWNSAPVAASIKSRSGSSSCVLQDTTSRMKRATARSLADINVYTNKAVQYTSIEKEKAEINKIRIDRSLFFQTAAPGNASTDFHSTLIGDSASSSQFFDLVLGRPCCVVKAPWPR